MTPNADDLHVDPGEPNRFDSILFGAAGFTGLALLFALQRYYSEAASGLNPKWSNALIGSFVVWWAWGALTPLIVSITRRLPLSSLSPPLLALQIPASIVVSVLHALIVATITPQFYWRPSIAPIRDMFRGRLSTALAFDMVFYFLIVAVVYVIGYVRESRRRQIASAQLEATLARTQLHALQAQLQPHFLFNTLNTIVALVHDDPARATLMIRRLSGLLRHSLASSDEPEVTLARELEFARAYLEIQKIRFETRLNPEFEIGEDSLDALVPSFVLQPLIENAVKFSLGDDTRVATIVVKAARADGRLELSVTDNGPGIQARDLEQSNGVGLRTTRARLQQLYGAGSTLSFESASQAGGTRVSISIPYKSSSMPADS